jgi:DNA-binding LacI/PurR family transcriptional regulator
MKHKTIDDIAREAGVSKATVSRVISHPELVSQKTQDKVRAVMDKHSYMPSLLAQGLAGTPTKTIGVIIDELSNFFFIEISEGIDRVLSASGYSMLLSSSRWVEDREVQLVRSLISSRVEGVLIAPINEDGVSMQLLRDAGIPYVVINSVPSDPTASYVCCDNLEGGRLAAQFLNAYATEQIIVITGFSHQSIEHRLTGFYGSIDHPEAVRRYEHVKTQEEGYALVPRLLAEDRIDQVKTTLFITNDNVAIGIINRLVESGISIPDQVSILGYDNIRISSLCRVPLTTISQSISETGQLAAQSLIKLLNQEEQTLQQRIRPTLIQREST